MKKFLVVIGLILVISAGVWAFTLNVTSLMPGQSIKTVISEEPLCSITFKYEKFERDDLGGWITSTIKDQDRTMPQENNLEIGRALGWVSTCGDRKFQIQILLKDKKGTLDFSIEEETE